jgi:hypothetical protein
MSTTLQALLEAENGNRQIALLRNFDGHQWRSDAIARAHSPFWTSRVPAQSEHPEEQSWPLPGVANYASAASAMAHFWQRTEASRLAAHFLRNAGSSGGDTDLNWVPFTGNDFKAVFLVNSQSR